MDPNQLLNWVQAAEALVGTGIMLETEFKKLFKQFNADLTPEQQHEALAAIKAEAARRKALAEGEVAATQAKVDAAEPPTPPVLPPDV